MDEKQPLVSIITPCYNQGKYLAETIDSVLAQTYKNWEMVIVDDGSSDNSKEVANSYANKDSRIRYIYQDNAGPSAARNNGVRMSHGIYIQFLDGDDKLAKDYIKKAVLHMISNPDCMLFYSRIKYFGVRNGEFSAQWEGYENLLCSNSITCSCCILRKDFERVGGFDEQLFGYEDWDFFIRLLYAAPNVYQSSEFLFYYRMTNSASNVNVQAAKRGEEIRRYIFSKNRTIYEDVLGSPEIVYAGYHRYKSGFEELLQSRTYRVGKAVLAPINWLRKHFYRFF